MSIYDYDNDFAHYELDKESRKKLGQIWTPYSIIERMMNMAPDSEWEDETKTDLDPTMGAGNIVIAMLYRRIVEHGQNPVIALSNVYGVELDSKTLKYARDRIFKFMKTVEKKSGVKWGKKDWRNIHDIIYCKNPFTKDKYPNFVCSNIFDWDIEHWCPNGEYVGESDELFM